MQKQKRLSKQQKLILKCLYDNYKKRPGITFVYPDGNRERRNRWQVGYDGAMKSHKLSGEVAERLGEIVERDTWGLFSRKKHTRYQSDSFRASYSRSLRRLRNRGLIRVWSSRWSYTDRVKLTDEGYRIAKHIRYSDCK